jgi:flavodoxin
MRPLIFYFSGTGNCLSVTRTPSAGLGGDAVPVRPGSERHLPADPAV